MALERRIIERAQAAGVDADERIAGGLVAFVGLLAKWNRTVNLTAEAVSPPSDEAIDRLIVEALVAERLVSVSARLGLDVGSGGGSPALPIVLARPALRMVLVESKARKCAFLREAVRELGLTGVEVVNDRLETVSERSDLAGQVDVITIRAVRLDEHVWPRLATLAREGGQLLHFGAPGSVSEIPRAAPFAVEATAPLPLQGLLTIHRRRRP